LPFSKENNIKVLAYSPVARGFLSGKYDKITAFGSDDHRSRSEDEYFQDEALPKNLRVLEKLKFIAKKLKKTPSQVALRWVLQNPGVTSVIFGVKNAAQVEENIVASDFTLSRKDTEFLDRAT
jgi:aryl-alcohol dehydrogenase-like predicted oxidoreductase